MTKPVLIAVAALAILVSAYLAWPNAKDSASHSPVTTHPSQSKDDVKPFATAEEFYQAWQGYLRGNGNDTARIEKSAAARPDWIDQLFPQSYSEFKDGIRLVTGKYRILYPYLTAALIDSYHIISTEVTNDDLASVHILIQRGANPNQDDILTAAHSTKMIDLLVKEGADPNRTDATGERPLKRFRRGGRPDLIEAMQRNGARD